MTLEQAMERARAEAASGRIDPCFVVEDAESGYEWYGRNALAALAPNGNIVAHFDRHGLRGKSASHPDEP